MLPLGEGSVLLVDVTLLLGAKILLFIEVRFDNFDVSLMGLVLRYSCLNMLLKFSNFTILCANLSFNGLTLLRNLNTLICTVIILNSESFKFLLKTIKYY